MEDNLQGVETERFWKAETSGFVWAVCVSLVLSSFFFVGGLSQRREDVNAMIDGRINPNTASIESLMRLDGIGASRACDIVEYRRSCGRQRAFEMADDLQAIRGIGPKTVEKIEHCLCFD